MSYLNTLTDTAKANGVEWDGRASVPKLIKALQDNGLEVPDDPGSNYEGAFKAIQNDFETMGKLAPKLKGIKDRGVKAEIRNRYALDLSRIKKRTTELKKQLLDAKDDAMYYKVLKWERTRKLINVPDEYTLNAYEQAQIKERCLCIAKTPGAIGAELDEEYAYFKHYDPSPERECNMYTVYIKYVKSPEDQIGRELAWDLLQGYKPEKDAYPPEKILYRRFTWKESEFERYFKEVE